MSAPIGMSKDELLTVLDDIRGRVAVGDSFEGHIEYLTPEDPESDADFDVRAGYRIGNPQGQGSFRLIEGRTEDEPDTEDVMGPCLCGKADCAEDGNAAAPEAQP
jgi:hypothetical protein